MSSTPQPSVLLWTTSVLTATILVYAVGAGITAAAGTRLALQLILIGWFGYTSIANLAHHVDGWSCYCSLLPH